MSAVISADLLLERGIAWCGAHEAPRHKIT
jgi:hypothetical protein